MIMMKMNRLKEIELRKKEIRELLESDQEVDLDALEEELRELDKEKEQIERRKTLLEGIRAAAEIEEEERQMPGAENPLKEDPKKEGRRVREERGQALKENRSVTVGSSNIIMPRHDATDIQPTFNEVSSLIDRVRHRTLIGGESFRQPYLAGYGEGDYTAEGADYADAEPIFNYAAINKAKITAYAEDTEEVLKLPAADYDAAVMEGISVALRKKITREILVGDGSTNHLVGIFSSAATAIDPETDLTLSAINEDTLDEIIYSFGGDEDVEDDAVLILNKKDLKAFAMLRTADGQKVYEIENRGNTGTINGVPFIINSACAALSDPNTPADAYCMAYGPLSNYTLAIFSDAEIMRSTDYKFKQGMIAHKGSIFVGGNVTAKNGFLRIKKESS
jgi:Predicted phage phi-C31 gp36 major capsid-like protein